MWVGLLDFVFLVVLGARGRYWELEKAVNRWRKENQLLQIELCHVEA